VPTRRAGLTQTPLYLGSLKWLMADQASLSFMCMSGGDPWEQRYWFFGTVQHVFSFDIGVLVAAKALLDLRRAHPACFAGTQRWRASAIQKDWRRRPASDSAPYRRPDLASAKSGLQGSRGNPNPEERTAIVMLEFDEPGAIVGFCFYNRNIIVDYSLVQSGYPSPYFTVDCRGKRGFIIAAIKEIVDALGFGERDHEDHEG